MGDLVPLIWLNMNLFLLDSCRFDAKETMVKITEEVDLWFLSQEIDKLNEEVAVSSPHKEAKGEVLLHSRRSFADIKSRLECNLFHFLGLWKIW